MLRLHCLLRDHSDWIHFKKLKSCCAYYDNTDDEDIQITLDYRKEIIPSLIHEALHHWYPKWSESKIVKHERLIVNKLTEKQVKNIIKAMAYYL